jgi:hypothetical protein
MSGDLTNEPREPSKKLMNLDDLVRLVFEELDLGIFDYLSFEHKGLLGDSFIGCVLVWYGVYCRTDMWTSYLPGIGELDYVLRFLSRFSIVLFCDIFGRWFVFYILDGLFSCYLSYIGILVFCSRYLL